VRPAGVTTVDCAGFCPTPWLLCNTSFVNADEYITSSPEETIELGRRLASAMAPPKLVLLRGDLGAGKTTLVKGIAEALQAAEQEDVTSPTFTLIHEYRGPAVNVFHIDLYRIDTQRELDTLGLEDLYEGKNLLLIEWGEKFPQLEQGRDLEIAIESMGADQRKIRISGASVWNTGKTALAPRWK
jgi:tRNA threonylcarbamoyladenosine biosynthesis protein TsaE